MKQEKTSKTKRIKQISVVNLFGVFNHTIPLKTKERITIIHGPNGFGKTMMLNLLQALLGPSFSNRFLQRIPFDEFRIDFEDKTSFWVTQAHPNLSEGYTLEEHSNGPIITYHATGKESYKFPSPRKEIPPSIIERVVPSLERVRANSWRYMLTGEILDYDDVIDRFMDQIPLSISDKKSARPEWLIDMKNVVSIRFIETQRLLSPNKSPREKSSTLEYAVTDDSKHLADEIRKKLAESATLSQSLDRTFPSRALSPTLQQLHVVEEELLDKLDMLEEKRSRLMSTGLLDQQTGSDLQIGSARGIESNMKAVLAIYVEDTEQKLGIFDELARKIDLLTTIINNRFLYKTMTIEKEQGIVLTTKNGTILPLENLSSGEQHELVLFYDLLFRITPGSLILIDEPELSLHVVWQEQFLQDVQRITELTDIDIILATHSPDIIGKRRDLMVELEGPENGERKKVNGKH